MGASNVARVFAWWNALSDRDIRALVFMANMALDKDHPPVYYGGWEAIAESMQGCASKRTTMKILKSLADAGAIVSSGQARAGVRAEYALALDPGVTFKAVGSGRHVSWESVERADPRVNATDTLRVNAMDTLKIPATDTQWVNATDTQRVNATDTPRKHSRRHIGIREEHTNSQLNVTSAENPEPDEKEIRPLTQQEELNRQTAELQKRYGKEMQGVPDA